MAEYRKYATPNPEWADVSKKQLTQSRKKVTDKITSFLTTSLKERNAAT